MVAAARRDPLCARGGRGPQRAQIRRSFRADVARRTRLLAAHGIKACPAGIHPAAAWSGTVFEVGLPPDCDVRLGGGLTLLSVRRRLHLRGGDLTPINSVVVSS
ncbi:hypothetical protein [Streptomyces sp. NBC_00211]|uniref:hypothetical protein n=1 Tax=Streptomyces sp. NBC_00211 TaxID=2975683 RepID=UPI00324BCA9A